MISDPELATRINPLTTTLRNIEEERKKNLQNYEETDHQEDGYDDLTEYRPTPYLLIPSTADDEGERPLSTVPDQSHGMSVEVIQREYPDRLRLISSGAITLQIKCTAHNKGTIDVHSAHIDFFISKGAERITPQDEPRWKLFGDPIPPSNKPTTSTFIGSRKITIPQESAAEAEIITKIPGMSRLDYQIEPAINRRSIVLVSARIYSLFPPDILAHTDTLDPKEDRHVGQVKLPKRDIS